MVKQEEQFALYLPRIDERINTIIEGKIPGLTKSSW